MASTTLPEVATEARPHKAPRPARPNYNWIHRSPLPLTIDPLPPLIPHNPLSILAIAWTYVRSIIRPTKQPKYHGTLSHETRSVHITGNAEIRALWENGFFGKGTLSRSEPTWLDREKKRRGLVANETSEDVTRRRRKERAEMKKERARKEREEIDATLKRERGEQSGSEVPKPPLELAVESDQLQANGKAILGRAATVRMSTSPRAEFVASAFHGAEAIVDAAGELLDIEHLQLCPEEAFFLCFALNALDIFNSALDAKAGSAMEVHDLFFLFQSYSTFTPGAELASKPEANNSFLANYAVYHHFRSLGWVVRPGAKFAVDWMIYNRGPVFSHAEFAVIVVPSYSHPEWQTKVGLKLQARNKPWHWLHMVNRVQSQVRKTLVLAFVEMPPPVTYQNITDNDPAAVLSKMSIQEITLKRWIPNRNRD